MSATKYSITGICYKLYSPEWARPTSRLCPARPSRCHTVPIPSIGQLTNDDGIPKVSYLCWHILESILELQCDSHYCLSQFYYKLPHLQSTQCCIDVLTLWAPFAFLVSSHEVAHSCSDWFIDYIKWLYGCFMRKTSASLHLASWSHFSPRASLREQFRCSE
jgi:hypothetical protein